jgi:hypothetical protein
MKVMNQKLKGLKMVEKRPIRAQTSKKEIGVPVLNRLSILLIHLKNRISYE